MPARIRRLALAAFSLFATYAFFFEYLPPFRWVHLPWDASGYHFPLLDYTFLSLKQGRFPLWDPTIYCGASFVGNIQAGLFYPPNWVLLAVNLGRAHVAFWSLEALVMAHVWIAFGLCYAWLRVRRLDPLASTLGAAAFACGGPLLMQFTHLGMVCSYAWMPLGFLAVDEASEQGRRRPLWKLVAASALCLLAGYPPSWFGFALCVFAYSIASRGGVRLVVRTAGALAFSVLVCMVQVLPVWEAASLKVPEQKFGHLLDPGIFVRFFVPNPFDNRMGSPLLPEGSYLYLGVAVIFGFGWLVRHPRCRACLAPLAVAAFGLYVMLDPGWLLWDTIVKRSALLADVMRGWNLLGVVALMAVVLAAHGLDGFLKAPARASRRWLAALAVGWLGAWSGFLIWLWCRGGAFASGWQSAIYAAALLVPFFLGLAVYRGTPGTRTRAWVGGALLLAAGCEYKAFGTSRQFNAEPEDYDAYTFGDPFRGLDDAVYADLLAHPEYRVVGDVLNGDFTNRFRHYGLMTPQGFDPLQTAAYRARLQPYVFQEDMRLFDLPPRPELLRTLGVRYYFTTEGGPHFEEIRSSEAFRLMEPARSYYQVFELRSATPAYRWEAGGPAGSVEVRRDVWRPEHREFTLRSPGGGRMVMVEQFYPGWTADIDGRKAAIERWDGAFQAVSVPGGEHRVRFRYRPWTLPAGAAVTLVSLLVFAFGFIRRR